MIRRLLARIHRALSRHTEHTTGYAASTDETVADGQRYRIQRGDQW